MMDTFKQLQVTRKSVHRSRYFPSISKQPKYPTAKRGRIQLLLPEVKAQYVLYLKLKLPSEADLNKVELNLNLKFNVPHQKKKRNV